MVKFSKFCSSLNKSCIKYSTIVSILKSVYKVACLLPMASRGGNESVLTDLNYVKCALCLDIFEDPYRLPCKHMYVYVYVYLFMTLGPD